MESSLFLHLLPFILSALLSLVILIYTWRRRSIRGAPEFSLYLVGQTLWVIGFLMELLSPNVVSKIFWDKAQWIAAVIVLFSLPYFAVRYSNAHFKREALIFRFLSIVPLCFTVLVFTDQFHHLLYPDPILVSGRFFSELIYTFTAIVYAFGIYSYLISLASITFLIINSPKSNRLSRIQLLTVSIGALSPILGTVFGILGIQVIGQRDSTPLFAAIGSLFIAWGLFRFKVFNFLPIARETIIDTMEDAVIVLDKNNRIVDLNQQAFKTLRMKPGRVIGAPVEYILRGWPQLADKFEKHGNFSEEVYYEENGDYYHYDVRSTLINSQDGELLGRIFVARDVSSYARLQWELKQLNEHLEERVAEKTRELSESYETTLEGWAKALELRDKETEGHSRRVVELTVQLAQRLGISEDEIVHLRRGAILHDIGKMAIPDEILRKNVKLNDRDWQVIQKHPETALHLLETIPYLKKAIDIPYCHHEHWDGSGYPRELRGEEIPLAARIFAVVDVWDALLSDRSYRPAWLQTDVVKYIEDNSGLLFDPVVVKAFLELVK